LSVALPYLSFFVLRFNDGTNVQATSNIKKPINNFNIKKAQRTFAPGHHIEPK
jgi:hypothetical protein